MIALNSKSQQSLRLYACSNSPDHRDCTITTAAGDLVYRNHTVWSTKHFETSSISPRTVHAYPLMSVAQLRLMSRAIPLPVVLTLLLAQRVSLAQGARTYQR